jgi:hypothetical protein
MLLALSKTFDQPEKMCQAQTLKLTLQRKHWQRKKVLWCWHQDQADHFGKLDFHLKLNFVVWLVDKRQGTHGMLYHRQSIEQGVNRKKIAKRVV